MFLLLGKLNKIKHSFLFSVYRYFNEKLIQFSKLNRFKFYFFLFLVDNYNEADKWVDKINKLGIDSATNRKFIEYDVKPEIDNHNGTVVCLFFATFYFSQPILNLCFHLILCNIFISENVYNILQYDFCII